jgi:DtxR family transcriptional regulator, Mn-dependent transcriptional regulator
MTQIKTTKLSASLEDYLEAIFHLAAEHTVARSKDIAERLGVSRASVTGALRALSKKDLIHYKPYDVISLTAKGRTEAERVIRRHTVLESFFKDILGLDAQLSRESACRAEHALGQRVVGRLMKYIEFATMQTPAGRSRASEFERFYKSPERQRRDRIHQEN